MPVVLPADLDLRSQGGFMYYKKICTTNKNPAENKQSRGWLRSIELNIGYEAQYEVCGEKKRNELFTITRDCIIATLFNERLHRVGGETSETIHYKLLLSCFGT